MSIPKEPRQLMINLMYLVLTAMLALNVSAEIINAFFALNKGLKTSSGIVANSNENMMKGIDKVANAYKTPINQAYQGRAVEAQKISAEFEAYIKSVTEELVKEAGGLDPLHNDGRPVRYKDKDVTTNLFLSEGQGKGRGAEIEKKIQEIRERFLKLADDADKKAMADQIALQVDSIPSDSKAKNWSELKFKQMPVAAVMPTLSKLVNDAKTSETTLLNYFLKKVNGEEQIKFDEFKVAIAPKKAYLIRGDKFEADIYLAAYSKSPGANISISANGSGLALKEGVAHYETTPGGIGKQTVNATASIRNPLTGATKETKGTFEYEVGEKSGTISAEKMNVFYMGVDNPVAISAAGVSSNSLRLNCTGCESLNKLNDNNYNVRVSRPGDVSLTMTGDGGFSVTKKFRAKQIPDPIAITTFNKKGGIAGSGEMASFGGLIAKLENFDFDARCSIQSYVLFRAPRREDPQQANVSGPTNAEAQRICQLAKPGDQYQFMEIKARCPGDGAARSLGSMGFVIK
jgi:gliding motility-associated protein GldM